MKFYHVYTDVSIKNEKYVQIAGVIVEGMTIREVFFKRLKNSNYSSNYLEYLSIIIIRNYIFSKGVRVSGYFHCDNKWAVSKNPKYILWVKGHHKLKKGSITKYHYNRLADYIAKNGLNNWKNYWHGLIGLKK